MAVCYQKMDGICNNASGPGFSWRVFLAVIGLFLRGSDPGRGENHGGPEVSHYQRSTESRSQDEETEKTWAPQGRDNQRDGQGDRQ